MLWPTSKPLTDRNSVLGNGEGTPYPFFPMRRMIFRSLLILSFGACGACAVEPTPRPNPERFASQIAAFAKNEPKKNGIVFTGSSSIRLWPHFKQDFSDLPVVNRGFGGSVSNDIIVHFETVVARNEPKLLVTYCGGNDLDDKLTVDEALEDYTKFLNMGHERFPKMRVLLNSVKIAPSRVREIPKVTQLNQRLQSWSSDKPWVRYLDSSSYLADASGQPISAYFREDRLHLNDVGYAKWKELLDPVLREEWTKAN